MNYLLLFLVSILYLLSSNTSAESIDKIAFGSCLKEDRDQPIWDSIISKEPDIFIFTGDNIYADTHDPKIMKHKYQLLTDQPGFQRLSTSTPIYATWDDHDYGQNDAGEENPIKEQSEQLFLDFYQISSTSPARERPGIYQSYMLGPPEKRIQLLILDTRYFRGALVEQKLTKECPNTNYGKQLNPDVSLLGHAQWQWLSQELKRSAKLRIIVSSIQVIPDEHCWEKWSNFPFEKEKLFNLIAKSKANGVLFISGDRHLAEVSTIKHNEIDYPIFEITSSGMNTRMYGEGEQNRHRLSKDNFRENNYGIIEIHWEHPSPMISLQIHNKVGEELFSYDVPFRDLNITNQ